MGKPNTLASTKIDKRARLYYHLKDFFKNLLIHHDGFATAVAAQNHITKGMKMMHADESIDTIQENLKSVFYKIAYELVPDNAYILNYPKHYLPLTSEGVKIIMLEDYEGSGGSWHFRYGLLLLNYKFAQHSNPLWFASVLTHEVAHIRDIDANDTAVEIKSLDEFNPSRWLNGTPQELVEVLSDFSIDDADMRLAAGMDKIAKYHEIKIILEVIARIQSVIALTNKYHKLEDVFNNGDYSILTEEGIDRFEKAFWPAIKTPTKSVTVGSIWD